MVAWAAIDQPLYPPGAVLSPAPPLPPGSLIDTRAEPPPLIPVLDAAISEYENGDYENCVRYVNEASGLLASASTTAKPEVASLLAVSIQELHQLTEGLRDGSTITRRLTLERVFAHAHAVTAFHYLDLAGFESDGRRKGLMFLGAIDHAERAILWEEQALADRSFETLRAIRLTGLQLLNGVALPSDTITGELRSCAKAIETIRSFDLPIVAPNQVIPTAGSWP
jgi:hypothetical protein